MNRRSLFELCGCLGVPRLALLARRHVPPVWLTVLAYHRVCEWDARSPWDPELVSATPEAFREQLAFIKQHFTPISSEQIVLWKKGRFAMPRNPIVLTFDDGYLDNYTVALPLLLEARVAADFFVCPWNIENRRLFWWDKVAFCLRRSPKRRVVLDYPHRLELDLSNDERRAASGQAVLAVIKHTRELDVGRLIKELQYATDVAIDETKEADRLLMTWEHVRALREAGMGVGSHSYSHPILPLTGERNALEEMKRSKAELEAQLDDRVCALAYPVGKFTDGTKRLARKAGYELAYSYCSGATSLRSADMFEVKRVAVERYMSLPYFRTMLAASFLSQVLRAEKKAESGVTRAW